LQNTRIARLNNGQFQAAPQSGVAAQPSLLLNRWADALLFLGSPNLNGLPSIGDSIGED
jgi:hypothetical protein